MKRLYNYLLLALVTTFGLMTIMVPSVGAIEVFDACDGQTDSKVCAAEGTDDAGSLVSTIVSVLLWALGAVSVIVIIIAGFTYVTANGDANRIQKAKNILMYAIIGLVVAILAYAIVEFVVEAF